jgi:serine/threonine-protein kinase
MALLPDHWRELETQLDRLLDASTGERPLLLDRLTANDAARRRELEHLVAECERPMPLLDGTAAERFADLAGDGPMLEEGSLLGERYEIRRELGRGGMAGVYLADDMRHSRSVAVKIVRPELAASLGRDRFLREISIVARMRHPNIMPLFDSGDADGLLYFIMPYEEGPSLRRRLESGPPLTIAESIGILGDIAKALAYAHERGVVHRDIKPDNVMLSGGTAVVADFGIAKAVSDSRSVGHDRTLTQAGTGMGTAAYMAPEQAVGDPSTNHRCDIYAFGCVAYELFTGSPPFLGESTFEIITAHLTRTPKPLGAVRPDVPAAIGDLIDQCLLKDARLRPQQATELLSVLTDSQGGPRSSRRSTRRRVLAGIAGVSVVAAAILVANSIRGRATPPGVAPGRTLVVLPMDNRTGDAGNSYLAAGMAEGIGKRLEGIGGIRVRSGARSEWPTSTRRDLDAIGAQFGSNILLRMTLLKLGDSLGADASVLDLETGTERTIARRRFTAGDIADAETDLAARIAAALFQAPLPADPQRSRGSVDPESYRLTLAGWYTLLTLHREDSARTLFLAAINRDQNNARAWSGLSSTWAVQTTGDRIPFDAGYEQVMAAARRALAIDDKQGSALANMGVFQARKFGHVSDGMPLIDSAIAVDPGNSEVFIVKAALYKNAWQWNEARKAMRIARALDPMSVQVLAADAQNEMCDGRFEAARALYESGIVLQPASSELRRLLARSLAALGRYDDAIRTLAEAAGLDKDTAMTRQLANARGADGYWSAKHLEGRRRLARLNKATGYRSARQLMMARFAAGDFDDGYRDLARLTKPEAQVALYRMPCMPDFDEVRNTARFKALEQGPAPP